MISCEISVFFRQRRRKTKETELIKERKQRDEDGRVLLSCYSNVIFRAQKLYVTFDQFTVIFVFSMNAKSIPLQSF